MNIRLSHSFEKELKHLLKKYPSLARDLERVVNEIRLDPKLGESIGKSCYKIRLAIQSKGKGKSGGARVITCVVGLQDAVVLLSIYDKSEKANISDATLSQLLKDNELDG